MRIRLGDEVLETPCRGCMCHEMAMTFSGGAKPGCCAECGCPQTPEAWETMRAEQEDTDA